MWQKVSRDRHAPGRKPSTERLRALRLIAALAGTRATRRRRSEALDLADAHPEPHVVQVSCATVSSGLY